MEDNYQLNGWLDWSYIVKEYELKKLFEDLTYGYITLTEYVNKLEKLRNERLEDIN